MTDKHNDLSRELENVVPDNEVVSRIASAIRRASSSAEEAAREMVRAIHADVVPALLEMLRQFGAIVSPPSPPRRRAHGRLRSRRELRDIRRQRDR